MVTLVSVKLSEYTGIGLEILPLNFAPDCAKIQITGFPEVFQTACC